MATKPPDRRAMKLETFTIRNNGTLKEASTARWMTHPITKSTAVKGERFLHALDHLGHESVHGSLCIVQRRLIPAPSSQDGRKVTGAGFRIHQTTAR